jgi:hypothetical protein
MERIELYEAYFGEDPSYYTDRLEEYEQGHKFTFNFCAGFFGLGWFLYRKMYVGAILLFVFNILEFYVATELISFINPIEDLNYHLLKFINLLFCFITVAYLGNYIYIRKSLHVVGKVLSEHKTEEPKRNDLSYLRMKGGVSLTAAAVPLIILFLVIIGVGVYRLLR